MKRISTSVSVAVIISIFILCFIIGRAIAMRDNEKNSQLTKQSQIVKEEVSLADSKTEKVEKKQPEEYEFPESTKTEKAPPSRMNFPCGQAVLKEYSQKAVYSKTMGDWRAHTGIDYSAEKGTEVKSTWDGVVSKTYKDSLWGYTVEITHDGNITSVYKNLDEKIYVKKGDSVKSGQAIGNVGDSAAVEKRDEPHLHFEIWAEGEPINPESYVY